jgi:hypothetical protein
MDIEDSFFIHSNNQFSIVTWIRMQDSSTMVVDPNYDILISVKIMAYEIFSLIEICLMFY